MKFTQVLSVALACTVLVFAGQRPCFASEADPAALKLIEELDLREGNTPIREHPRWRKPEVVHIAVPSGWSTERLEWVKSGMDGVELVPITLQFGRASTREAIAQAEVLVGWCHPDILKYGKNLRWMQSLSVGIDKCSLSPEFKNVAFILTNAKRLSGPSMADNGIAMTMMLTRNLGAFHHAMARGDWDRSLARRAPMLEVRGKTMLVVGLGGIGTEIARRAAALGMRVVATRNSSRTGPAFVDYVGLADELHQLAAQAHVTVNALPLTPKTLGLFDKEFFDAARPGSYFISLGRGKSTVTPALVDALKSGKLAGAGLDVTDPEPLPPDHELWGLDNVIITPHVSARSDLQDERRWTIVRENLRRYVAGEPLLNLVDMEKGY